MNEASKKKYLIIGGILVVVVLLVFGGITLLAPKPTSTNVASNVSKTSSSVTSSNSLSSTPSDSVDESTNYAETTIKIGSSNNKLPSVTLSDNPIVAKANTSSSSNSSEEAVTTSSSTSSTTSSVSLVSNVVDLGTKTPANVLVTNKDYKRWSVVWTTSIATVGKLKVTAPGLNKTYSDDRSEFANTKSFTHHVTVTNDDDLLSAGNPTFTYTILVDGEEAGDHTYVNAPLLSSPSSPTTAVLKLNPSSKSKDIILTGRIKTGSTYSDYLSSIIDSSSSSSMVLGIARSTALSQYVSLSSPNTLEITAYGNAGKSIGSKTGITLTSIDESIVTLNVTLASSQIASSSSARSSNATTSSRTGNSVPNTAISGTDELISFLAMALLILGISVYELGRFGMRSRFEKKVIDDV
jgi:hypothetical protein